MTPIERQARAKILARPLRGSLLSDSKLSIATVILATTFNAILAVINANIVGLNSAVVIASEVLITATAAVLGLNGRIEVKQVWVALAGTLILIGFGTGLASGHIDPKFMRDVLLIPVFVILGLSCSRRDVIRTVMILQGIVLVFLLLEGISPTLYGKLLNVMGYYINTRGFEEKQFWNGSSDLFISATRPGERFIGGLDLHRLSSIFLEPVSLGNYCVIVAAVMAALWSSLSLQQRVFLALTELMILVGSDGRFAAVAIVFIVGMRFIAPLLPRSAPWFYLPGVVAAGGLAVVCLDLQAGGDDFKGRTAGSIVLLSHLDGASLLGFTTTLAYHAMDSGIAYLVLSQSLLGTAIIWSFVSLGLPRDDEPSVVMTHAVCLYVSLLLLISYSLFSIKTAALLWFSYGAIARPVADRMAAAVRRRPLVPVMPRERTE